MAVLQAEFIVFLVLKGIILLVGGSLAALGYDVYRRNGEPAFLRATIGFALVTVGASVDAAYGLYEVAFRDGYELTGLELLAVNSLESLFLASGLVLLFYTIASFR